jgi:hypothetical protein
MRTLTGKWKARRVLARSVQARRVMRAISLRGVPEMVTRIMEYMKAIGRASCEGKV